jgi:hypothetical protein
MGAKSNGKAGSDMLSIFTNGLCIDDSRLILQCRKNAAQIYNLKERSYANIS